MEKGTNKTTMKTNKVLTRPQTKTLQKGKRYQQTIVKKMKAQARPLTKPP
jgi:hypothetical protein